MPALTVAENIALALPSRASASTAARAAPARSTRRGERTASPSTRARSVRDLSIGERQRVEILKVLMAGARLVILDEPTSVLAPQEVDALFAGVARAARAGPLGRDHHPQAAEARAIADRVTVLRGGKLVVGGVRPDDARRRRAGRGDGRPAVPPLPTGARRRDDDADAGARAARRHASRRPRRRPRCDDVDLEVRRGELVGVAGVAGNGQRELSRWRSACGRSPSGRVAVVGTRCGRPTPARRIAAGARRRPRGSRSPTPSCPG